jgi:hypothetical protein
MLSEYYQMYAALTLVNCKGHFMSEPSQAHSSTCLAHVFKCHLKAAVMCVYFKISSINANSLTFLDNL